MHVEKKLEMKKSGKERWYWDQETI